MPQFCPKPNSRKQKAPENSMFIRGLSHYMSGGERGIRTLDTLLTYTHFPGVRLQPLGHLSAIPGAGRAGSKAR